MTETDDSRSAEKSTSDTAAADAPNRLSLSVAIENAGPCRKHVRVVVPRADIDRCMEDAVDEFADKSEVPGFRVGRVPKALVSRRFKKELLAEVKQRVLLASLEQLSEENDLDPINEPKLDVDTLEIPDEGDFEYEFDVEVRPDFSLPAYEGLKINKPVREITDEDIDEAIGDFLAQYGELQTHDGPAEPGDSIVASVEFEREGEVIRDLDRMTIRLRPVLRFQDAELEEFDQLMAGVQAGESREASLMISLEAENIAMRGEPITARFHVKEVRRHVAPELTRDLMDRMGVESEEALRDQVRSTLERQVTYAQRQATRSQVLEKITESADWELPEELVSRQVENALYRETLEMQQAGFSTADIRARENELRQKSISTTRQAMKEHFVLDKIATEENIEVSPNEIDFEIQLMAMQRGESPRRLRARLTKSGVIENLEAQIRERKAVDVVLERAVFEDVELPRTKKDEVTAVNVAICGIIDGKGTAEEDESDERESDE